LSYIACLVYLDDIIVFGRSFEEQLSRLEISEAKTETVEMFPFSTQCLYETQRLLSPICKGLLCYRHPALRIDEEESRVSVDRGMPGSL